MDSARDAVLQLQVHLGYGVLREDGGIRDVTCRELARCLAHTRVCFERRASRRTAGERRTNGSRLNHVADGEALDGLVLGRASRAVAAADGLDVAAALLVAAAVKWLANIQTTMGHRRRRSGRGMMPTCNAVVHGRDVERRCRRREEGGFVLVLSLLDHFGGVCCSR